MSKQITFAHEGKEYILEYTRASVKKMEARGFVVTDVSKKPVSSLPLLFAGAFLAHHPYEKKEVVDTIFDQFRDKEGLLQKLGEMYNDPIRSMTESEGNLEWKANW